MSALDQILDGSEASETQAQALMEAMYAAAAADGEASPGEMDTLRARLETHPLFSKLGTSSRARLLRAAIHAVNNAESPADHARVIATHLASRTERVAAYTLACEVCACDEDLSEGEVLYLESLQRALAIPDAEAESIFSQAKVDGSVRTLDEQIDRMGKVLPYALDAMALMATADGVVTDEEVSIMERVVRRISDVRPKSDREVQDAVRVAFDRVTDRDPDEVLRRIAGGVPSTGDRYWLVVYMLVVALADGKKDWRELQLLSRVEIEFKLPPETIDAATMLARRFLPKG